MCKFTCREHNVVVLFKFTQYGNMFVYTTMYIFMPMLPVVAYTVTHCANLCITACVLVVYSLHKYVLICYSCLYYM